MSTLPFLLSVADELDNINSQSYMDDFGLGFHPHRHYYRTPTIQLSLPASTDWMEQERQRCRPHRFVLETQNNLQAAAEEDEEDEAGNGAQAAACADNAYADSYGDRYAGSGAAASAGGDGGPSTSAGSRHKYVSALNSNNGGAAGVANEAESVDNSVKRYNLSKKCCKNYYRRGDDTTTTAVGAASAVKEKSTDSGYRLHTKCMEGNNSSSDESLQKVSSSIEFLTCFLVKKSRAPKNSGAAGKKS